MRQPHNYSCQFYWLDFSLALATRPAYQRDFVSRPDPGTDGPNLTDRVNLTACPTTRPLFRGLAESPIHI